MELENEVFNNQFTTMATDKIYANRMLNPTLTNKLLDFISNTRKRIVSHYSAPSTDTSKREEKIISYFSFKDQKLYLLLHTNMQHLEYSVDKKPDKDTIYYQFQDINQILLYIDEILPELTTKTYV